MVDDKRPQLRYEALRNRETATHITVEDAYAQGFVAASGRWQTVCWNHRKVVDHPTLASAMAAAPHPLLWCESCAYDKELAELRASMEASIAEEHGKQWLIDHKGLLDSQWDFLVRGGFL